MACPKDCQLGQAMLADEFTPLRMNVVPDCRRGLAKPDHPDDWVTLTALCIQQNGEVTL